MNLKAHSYLNDIQEYIPGASRDQKNLNKIVKMSSNENPLGSPFDSSHYEHLLSFMNEYPDIASSNLPSLIANFLDIDSSNIIFVNGSDEILQLVSLAYLDKFSNILSISNTFSQYKFMAQISGANYIEIPINDQGFINLDLFINEINVRNVKCVCLASPNNPTGVSFTFKEVNHLLSSISKDVLFILDQAYIDFDEDLQNWNISSLINRFSNLLIMRTFSKAYGLAGVRLGYCIANNQISSVLNKVKQPFNVNSMALKAAELAFKNKDFITQTLKNNFEQKKFLYKSLNNLNISYFHSSANFVCIKFPFDVRGLVAFLKDNFVLVRPLHSFGLPFFMRVSIGLPTQNELFINLLKEYLSNHA